MPNYVGECGVCGTMCFVHEGHDPICLDCYMPENPTVGWKLRRWFETKGGKPSELRQYSTTSQKEAFLNRELGIKVKKRKKEEETDDR